MQIFKINARSAAYSITFFMVCFLIYTLQQNAGSPNFPLSPSPFTMKIQQTYRLFAQNVSTAAENYLLLLDLKKQISSVEQENQKLKAELLILDEIKLENERLTQLNDLRSTLPNFTNTPARITGKDLFTDHASLFIDKGADHKIANLAGVITYEGVVGYTIDTQDASSRILLLTDRLMSIDAVVQRTRSRGIVSGHGKNLSALKFLDRPQDLTVGDVVVTSSEQKMFPSGFPIGQITSIYIHPSGVGHYAVLHPIVDTRKVSEVLVLKAK
jgi:rod shape-determining protein MreC